MTVYTVGIWRARAGQEDAFVEAWNALAQTTREDFPSAAGTLLRDRDETNLFVSFGPWDSVEQIAKWRSSDGFVHGVARMRDLLESFEAHTMDLTTHVG